jgi:hypothetical protein
MWLCSSSRSIIEGRDPSTDLNILTIRASLDTVKKYARDKGRFVVLDSGKVALKTAG